MVSMGFLVGLKQPVLDRLKVSLNVGERSSQLVGHIGNQVPPLFLCVLQTPCHGVERPG